MNDPLLALDNVSVRYGKARDSTSAGGQSNGVRAVEDVSLRVYRGEVLGLVGESGSGKSSIAKVAASITEASQGEVYYAGRRLSALSTSEMRQHRRKVQMVFQNPYASLNPRMRVGDAVGEAVRVFERPSREHYARILATAFERVGLPAAAADRFPHEFSGGQRQRIVIARALASRPEVLVCDEAVSALDASIQGQLLDLLTTLRSELGLGVLFISHDLQVIRHIADRVMVMYLGRIVEEASAEQLFRHPSHPYTRLLLASMPRPKRRDGQNRTNPDPVTPLSGMGGVLDPSIPPTGCHFRSRCSQAIARCAQQMPTLLEIRPGHRVACHVTAAAVG